jgi:hypothetical protein
LQWENLHTLNLARRFICNITYLLLVVVSIRYFTYLLVANSYFIYHF